MDIEGQVSFVDLQSFLEELVEKIMTPAKSEDIRNIATCIARAVCFG